MNHHEMAIVQHGMMKIKSKIIQSISKFIHLSSITINHQRNLNIQNCLFKFEMYSIVTIHRNFNYNEVLSQRDHQMIISLCYLFDKINYQSVRLILRNRMDILSKHIFVTSLNNEKLLPSNTKHNQTVFEELNEHAKIRENLILSIGNLSINTIDQMKFQLSRLVQLIRTTNQIT